MIAASLRGPFSQVGSSAFRALSSAVSFPDFILQAPETKIASLSNGVKVATEARGGGLANLSLTIVVGSRFETESTNGMSSLLKELGFAGKSSEISALGGRFSAEVGRESIAFKATVLPSDVKPALKVLVDAACLKNLTAQNLEAAKGSVLCHITGAQLRPEEHVMEHLYDAAFLDSPMGMPVFGTKNSVASIGERDLTEFASKNILGSRVVVSGAGEVHHNEMAHACESLLGSLTGSKLGEVDFPLEECPFVGSDKRVRYDNKPLAHIAMAFKGPSLSSEYYFPSQLAMSIMGKYEESSGLGTDSSSRWHISLAEHTKTVSAEAFSIGYKDTGLMGFKAIASDCSLDNLMWFTMENFMRICYKVTDEEVLRAKIAFKAKLLKDSASSSGACDEIAHQVSNFGRRIHPTELMARIDGITTEQVRETAYRFIHDQDHALGAVGPIYELPDYNW
eukprot:CAMPEP_0171462564 /NCGR_PEP_ID=MMETSP0945-20130129/6551_1 /TAXON_ID=109269 /ORGANISM="Vaucheria litorea, Strain CCMP2940" /LENGTH=451 /DNA_ID=CAMNT_0011989115 /DNA_START=62 /DNA_END=1414 /DNA_ORIENTATION=-